MRFVTPNRCLTVLLVALGVALTVAPATAQWQFRAETQEGEDRGADPLVSQHGWSRSVDGYGILELVCTAGGQLFIMLDYLSFETRAGEVRISIQIDQANPLINRWQVVESPMNTLTAISTNPVLVGELANRLMVGSEALVLVESLPRLTFDLTGSNPALSPVIETCDEINRIR